MDSDKGALHEIHVMYVPVCEECGQDVYLDDAEVWRHVVIEPSRASG
jgi:uncharacterized protein (DUF983 family)